MPNPLTRPTMDSVLSMIESASYTRLPSGTAIVCELILRYQHPVHGIAVVVDMDNDNEILGKKAAYDKAVAKVWEIAAYDMHQKMANGWIENNHWDLVHKWQHENGGKAVTIETVVTPAVQIIPAVKTEV